MPFAVTARPTRRLVFVAVAVGATVASVLSSSTAFAAPNKGSTAAAAAQAQAKLDALGVQADKAVEAYDQAQEQLKAATSHAQAQQQAVAKAKAKADAAKAHIQSFIAAEYENGPTSTTLTVLLSGDSSSALQKAALLQQVNRAQTAGLTKVVNAERELRANQARANQSLAAVQAANAKLAAQKATVEKALAAQQALENSLQTQLTKERAAAAAAAAVAARAARLQTASRSQSRPRLATRAAPVAVPHAAGNAAAALRYAYAQLGKPYRWGGAGPGSFDCSGLTMRAWGAAGVSLSHSSSSQQHQGTPVPLSALQPGDLIFWGYPAYHVGMYVGNGQMIDAPHTGTVVQIQSIWGHPSGAVRP